MNNNESSVVTQLSAVAITREQSSFKAVELRKQRGSFEVLWTKSSDEVDTDWLGFATECGLDSEPSEAAARDSGRTVVVGFDSSGVAFRRIGMPVVEKDEISAIVKLQAESLLPLPMEQMELTWRTAYIQDGEMAVTVVAAKRERLQGFVRDISGLEPAKILLDCEGIVKVWRVFFSGNGADAVVVSAEGRSMQVCLTKDGQLSNAVVLDMGTEDFSYVGGSTEHTEAAERFTQDMRSVLDLFGCVEPTTIFVLSDGSDAIQEAAATLKSAGLDARAVLPDIKKMGGRDGIDAEGIYKYRMAIGLALIALEPEGNELNIFEQLYSPARKEEKKHWLYSPRITCAIAAIMLVLMLLVSYAVDVATPNAIEKMLEASISETDMEQLIKRHELIKAVARERPDVLSLIKIVNETGASGIKLEGIHFKKGQPVSVSGQASSPDSLYKFEKALQNNKNIKDAEIKSSSKSPKGGKLKFTITFSYKNFSQKKSRR